MARHLAATTTTPISVVHHWSDGGEIQPIERKKNELRAQWGLASNPDLMGQQVDVTGALASYFSHPGMTGTSAIGLADGTTPEDPEDPGDPGEPTDPGSY